MVIVNILVEDKEQGDSVAMIILKSKFTLNVFGNVFDSFRLNATGVPEKTSVYVIQFLTKSMLYNDIESTLAKEFPHVSFSICATPIVHISINLHNMIREKVSGIEIIHNSNTPIVN